MAELPFDAGEVSGLEKGFVFGGILKANSKQSKFVLSIRASDIFEILSFFIRSRKTILESTISKPDPKSINSSGPSPVRPY